MKKTIISFMFFISVITVSAQSIQEMTDAEIYEILMKSEWSYNPHEFNQGWRFGSNGIASPWGNVVIKSKKYFVKDRQLYLSKLWDDKPGFEELTDNDISEFDVIELKYEVDSLYSLYSIKINNYKYYSIYYSDLKGEIRKFQEYQVLMGDYPEENNNELYSYNPENKDYTGFYTSKEADYFFQSDRFFSYVFTLKDCSRYGRKQFHRKYIGSTVIKSKKWYLVSLVYEFSSPMDYDGYENRYAWTDGQTKPVSIIYDYYHAINTQDWEKGYELSHKKIDFETWKSIYEGCNIDIYGSHKLADHKWKFIVRLTDSAKEITWYEVEFTLGDKSILSSKSTVTYERIMGK
jgi:hypothetical protein